MKGKLKVETYTFEVKHHGAAYDFPRDLPLGSTTCETYTLYWMPHCIHVNPGPFP